ncbi:MAG TPA: hypothetical protein VNX61_02040, partial [Rhizomicrobium sp.]|nr:hypothetical protein [Rhizomicrobium sp.]
DWLRRDGDGRALGDALGLAGLACDGLGCVVQGKTVIATSLHAEALDEDCIRAKVVVSAAHAVGCKGPAVVIDKRAAEEGEGWRITFSPNPYAISVRALRGERPWVVIQPSP